MAEDTIHYKQYVIDISLIKINIRICYEIYIEIIIEYI